MIFYKVKRVDDRWYAIFVKDDDYKIINNDRDELIEYLNNNKDSVFVGANNFMYDDIYLASIIKNGNVTDNIEKEDLDLLPITLDITEGINDNLVDLNSIICNTGLPNFYALNESEINEELINKVYIIKRLYDVSERKKYLNWKMSLIDKYNLPKEDYRATFSKLMQDIVGININEDNENVLKFTLDKRLQEELNKRNDPFLNELLKELENYYCGNNDIDENKTPTRTIGNCPVIFNKHGLHGTRKGDYFDPNGDYSYLYIDFNSFGPSILINNKWLNDVSINPNRYEEIRDLRFDLKAKKDDEQMFYKHILNDGLDNLYKVSTKDGNTIALSITVSGIMTMMLLYRTIEKYGVEVLESNTDGFIVKCPKEAVSKIQNEVSELSNKLSLSCDADEIKRIIHFDDRNYIMEYADGTIKHIGVFGIVKDHPLYKSGIPAVDESIRNYYLFNIPVSVSLRSIRDDNDILAFQIVKKYRSNEKTKYLNVSGNYIEAPFRVHRLFPFVSDKVTDTLYTKNKDKYERISEKKGSSVKDGFYYFQLADREMPSIHDIDLTYYIDKCYKIIDAHPKQKNIYIASEVPNRYAFVDLDGTLVYDSTEEIRKKIFIDAASDILDEKDMDLAYYLFSGMSNSFIVQFLSVCKKEKAYGTINNFALFLKEKNLFPGVKDIKVYNRFVKRYVSLDLDYAKRIMAYNNSKETLEKLKNDGYMIILYSNWFKDNQIAKLQANNLEIYFDKICTIEEYYAKSTVIGWTDLLEELRTRPIDLKVMFGNSSTDIVPKRLGIPTIIINHNNKEESKKVKENGIIIHSFEEVKNKRFTSELEEMKLRNR